MLGGVRAFLRPNSHIVHSTQDQATQQLGWRPVAISQYMRIDPQRYCRVGVPQPSRNCANVDAGGDCLRGREMTKVVKTSGQADLPS